MDIRHHAIRREQSTHGTFFNFFFLKEEHLKTALQEKKLVSVQNCCPLIFWELRRLLPRCACCIEGMGKRRRTWTRRRSRSAAESDRGLETSPGFFDTYVRGQLRVLFLFECKERSFERFH